VSRQFEAIREAGAEPILVGMLEGELSVGLSLGDAEILARMANPCKVNLQNLAASTVQKVSGGTTVSATLYAADEAGLSVMATGGIGGVHRNHHNDVSSDLTALSVLEMLVVCAGPKAILDIPATAERLETDCVPVVGYRTDTIPAFYSVSSGVPVSSRVDTAAEAAALFRAHAQLTIGSSVLLCQPPPEDLALPMDEVEAAVALALAAAEKDGISGRALTPYLLARFEEPYRRANTALLIENARLAAKVAVALGA